MTKRKKKSPAPAAKPIMISPVPAVAAGPVSRPMSAKRISRLRLNWFVVGSVFGVSVSFFMNLLVTTVIVPQYDAVMARHGSVAIAETDRKEATRLASVTERVAAPEVVAEAKEAVITYPRNVTLEVASGDTLIDMLVRENVQPSEAHNAVAALRKNGEFNPRSLRIGQKISLKLARHEQLGDKAAIEELAIKLPNLSTVELERAGDGFNVAAIKEQLTTSAYRATGTVRSSLSQAASDAGIGGAAFAEIVQAFSYDVDFQREIHPGDKIEVLLDRKLAKSGEVGGFGDVRYAALTLQGKKREIFKFKDSFGTVAWFDAKGNSVKKSLLRTPINAARITSGFGMRRHPILGYSKMHQGTDFGASTGTPIMAAGDGIVKFKGWSGGYGNFVMIQHNGTYATAYGHMSRFANIRQGGRVKQGQVIGYVGTTGRSTGPHLHYEVRQNGRQVNPAAKQFNLANALTGAQLTAFNGRKAAISKELASLAHPAKPQQVASR